MNMNDAAIAVAEFGAEQWGLITSAQARALGVTAVQMKRLADRGALERVHHGIYRMTRLPYDPRQDLRVAWVALDPRTPAWERLSQPFPGGVVSHRSAAQLHGLGDLDADLAEFTCRRRIRLSLPDVRIHTGTVEVHQWTVVDGLPVTTAQRTIADLAATTIDGGHLAGIVRDALAHELVSVPELEQTLAASAFDYGHALGDGRAFLDALIAQAGVSTNTLGLADAYRRSTGSGTDNRAAVAGPLGRKPSDDALLTGVLEKIIGAQLAPLREQVRALADASLGAPALQAARQSIQASRHTPATDALRDSPATAAAPLARQTAATTVTRPHGGSDPAPDAEDTRHDTPEGDNADLPHPTELDVGEDS